MPGRIYLQQHPALKAWVTYLDVELPVDAFCISGQSLLFQSSDPMVRSLVKTHWGAFEVQPSSLRKVHAVFSFRSNSNPALPPLRRLHSFFNEHFVFLSDGKRYVLTAYLYDYPWQFHCGALPAWDPNFIYYYIIEPVLLDFLKKHGLLMLHSAAVSRNGVAVLLPGISGSGKSTTTLNFLNLGYQFLGDDLVLLRARGNSVEATGHESGLYLTARSLQLLPEWKKFKRGLRSKKGGQFKHHIDLRKFRPPANSKAARVKFLLFPRVTNRSNTRLQSLSAAQAMIECLHQVPKEHPSSILGPSALESQFDVYSKLVDTAHCYRLHLGTDPHHLQDVLSQLAQT